MTCSLQRVLDFSIYVLRSDANTGNQFPRERVFDEKLGLLVLLHGLVDPSARPLISFDCIPTDLVQSEQVRVVLEVGGTGVGGGKCPAPTICVRPSHSCSQVRFQMNDRCLTASKLKLGMIAHRDHVEHDGSWTEVEGHAVAYMQTPVAAQSIPKSALLDVADSDSCSGSLSPCHFRIGPQIAVRDNRGQPVGVDDVVYLRLSWNKHNQASLWGRVATDSLSIVSHSTAPSGRPAAASLMGRSVWGLTELPK